MSEVKASPRIQDLNKFSLFTDIPGVEKQRARLTWSMRGDQPRITVFMFNPATNRNDNISAPLSPEVFFYFCDKFEEVINGNPGVKYKIDCLTAIRTAEGKITDEKKLICELWFGQDNDGMIWLSLIEGDKPRLKFNFSLWDYNKIYKPDGEVLSAAEASIGLAKGVIRALRDIYTINLAQFTEYTAAAAKTSTAPSNVISKTDATVLEDLTF